MNILNFQWSINLLGILALFAACDEKEEYPYHPYEQSYFVIGHDAMQDDEVVKSFGVYLKILEPEDLTDDWSWNGTEPDLPWERVQLYGQTLSHDLAWVDNACGPDIQWKFVDEDAYKLIRSFYKDFPLQSKEEVDAVLAQAHPEPPALDGTYNEDGVFKPSEESREKSDAWRAEHTGWLIGFTTPSGYLQKILKDHVDTELLADVLTYYEKQVQDIQWPPFSVHTAKIKNDLPEEATKAKELVAYLEDFSDAALRAYLEKNKPECVVK